MIYENNATILNNLIVVDFPSITIDNKLQRTKNNDENYTDLW